MSDAKSGVIAAALLIVIAAVACVVMIRRDAPARAACEDAGNVWLQGDRLCVGGPK